MKKIILLTTIVGAFLFTGCTSEGDAQRALEAEGYKNIQYTGFKFFSCGENDTYRTGFKATNMNGRNIDGVVCSGFLKGVTIRY